jgi:RNA polymerase sigma-70 factor (ECF subfamily)
MAWYRAGRFIPDARIDDTVVNGQPGAIVRDGHGGVIAVWAIDVVDGHIQTIRSVVNPEKLAHIGPPGAYPGS